MLKGRYIKTVIFSSINDLNSIEATVNKEVDRIRNCGGKVISIFSNNWGISPMNLIYTIVYEHEKLLSEEDLNAPRKESEGHEK